MTSNVLFIASPECIVIVSQVVAVVKLITA